MRGTGLTWNPASALNSEIRGKELSLSGPQLSHLPEKKGSEDLLCKCEGEIKY